MELSVIIPSYLEEENLRLFLPRLQDVLANLGVTHEVIVVDTPQPMDRTGEVCSLHGARYLPRTGGNSYGCAIRSGLAASQGHLVVLMDADGSHAPEFIADLYRHAGGADIVIASRYVAGGGNENPGSLILMSRALNYLYTIVLGLKCRDVSNSFKLYGGDTVRSLWLRCENFDIVEEMLVRYKLAQPDMKTIELPYVFKKRMFGQTKRNLPLFIFTFTVTLVRLLAIRFSHERRPA